MFPEKTMQNMEKTICMEVFISVLYETKKLEIT